MSLDWGTVPAWVGSILTGGSLLLGFYILLRDRRNREIEQARQVSAHLNFLTLGKPPPGKENESGAQVTVYNSSSASIFDILGFLTPSRSNRHLIKHITTVDESFRQYDIERRVGASAATTGKAKPVTIGSIPIATLFFTNKAGGRPTIVAGQEATVQRTLTHPYQLYYCKIMFVDARGIQWILDVQGRKLKRMPRRRMPLRERDFWTSVFER